jgi:hypothetical protein
VKSGPDVFADALVSGAAADDAGALIFQNSHTWTFSAFTREAVMTRIVVSRPRCIALPAVRSIVRYAALQSRDPHLHCAAIGPSAPRRKCGALRSIRARDRIDGYRFAKRQGKPNSACA